MIKTSCGFIIYYPPKNQILLGKETHSAEYWSIPKGGKEDEENNYEAALRELQEESNISKDFIKSCEVYELKSQSYNSKKKKLIPFLAICEEKPEDIRCIATFVDSFGRIVPEFSRLAWFDIDKVIMGTPYIHETQIRALEEIKEKLKEI
jgi:8-oxo-dGTP pyrophosphatase MutT (NUDIX family)